MAYTYRNRSGGVLGETVSFTAPRLDLPASGHWDLISDTLDASAAAAVAKLGAGVDASDRAATIAAAAAVTRATAALPASRGVANGVASLDSAGQVPLGQLGNAPSGGGSASGTNVLVAGATDVAGGTGILAIKKATVAPTTTPVAGGVLYVDTDGALHFVAPSGADSILASA